MQPAPESAQYPQALAAGQFKHSELLLTGVQLVFFVAIHPKTSATG